MKLIVHTDGGTRKRNPGKGAYGFVVYRDRDVIMSQGYGIIGISTNNVAEFIAVRMGLTATLNLGAEHKVVLRSDSQIVVGAMNGQFLLPKSPHLRKLCDSALEIAEKFSSFTAEWVPRAENAVADQLCRIALRERWPT